jgi:dephospho-CoA kinase
MFINKKEFSKGMIIGITGPISAGKGKVAEFFRDKGFTHHSFSSEIREIAKERGIEVNRKNLGKLGTVLRRESPGKSILAGRLLATIKREVQKGVTRFVIEGIRDADEIALFREHELENKNMRFVLIGVDAQQKMRFTRMKLRGRHGDPKTFAEFKKIDDEEIKGGGGQEVGKCMKMADYVVKNGGTMEELGKKVQDIALEIL